ncbi:MAG: D-alanyl-D-alanine carboxypeptidase [Bacillota bacterium]|nr:D-alanyl-D-alanine carboxypeptidase [Bacillota bacterium]
MKNKFLIFIFISLLLIRVTVSAEPNINSRYALVLDGATNIVLYNKNGYDEAANASTTKIVTALTAIKYGNLDNKYTISKKAAKVSGSKVGYKEGEEISLRELLYGLMLRSGNDAAIAIAEGIGKSEENFMNMVNSYIKEMGVTSTHFTSPHGLDNDQHYSTAYDLAYFTSIGMKNPVFNEIVSTKDTNGQGLFTRSYHNINKILYLIPEANGVKTGFTGKAGKCLVTSINTNDRNIIIVLLNCSDRWNITKKLYNYVKDNYSFKTILKKGETVSEISIPYGNKKAFLTVSEDVSLPVGKDESLSWKVYMNDSPLPVKKGDRVGTLCVFKEDDVIYSCSLYSQNDIDYRNKFRKWYENLKKKLYL